MLKAENSLGGRSGLARQHWSRYYLGMGSQGAIPQVGSWIVPSLTVAAFANFAFSIRLKVGALLSGSRKEAAMSIDMSTNWLITGAATVIGALAMAPCEPIFRERRDQSYSLEYFP